MNLRLIFILLTMINVISFITYGFDKLFAIKGKWRIREFTLLVLSVLGGGVGSMIAMVVFKHKLSKRMFRILIPLTIITYWALIFYFIWDVQTVIL